MARQCFWINPTQDVSDGNGYVPALVTENEPGFQMLGDRNSNGITSPRAWFWGSTLEEAQEVCASSNAKKGLTPEDVSLIIASSMAASRA